MNVIGEPVDEGGKITTKIRYRSMPRALFDEQSTKVEISRRGSRSSTSLPLLEWAERIGLFGGAGVGKTSSSWSSSTIRHRARRILVFGGVGRAHREGNDLWLENEGVEGPREGVPRVRQMNEPPGAAPRGAVGPHGGNISATRRAGRPPLHRQYLPVQPSGLRSVALLAASRRVGYQPTLSTEMGNLQSGSPPRRRARSLGPGDLRPATT